MCFNFNMHFRHWFSSACFWTAYTFATLKKIHIKCQMPECISRLSVLDTRSLHDLFISSNEKEQTQRVKETELHGYDDDYTLCPIPMYVHCTVVPQRKPNRNNKNELMSDII